MQFLQIRRLTLSFIGQPLEHTVVAMAIPMIYAHWEGYVKEVCQLYLEHIESTVLACSDLDPILIGYLWRPVLRPLTGGMNAQRNSTVAREVVQSLHNPILFSDAEKQIDTRSNLNFAELEKIAEQLCVDVTSLSIYRRHLNTLVHIRNHIAHGSIPSRFRLPDLSRNRMTRRAANRRPSGRPA